jgi:hypothetical protein
MSLSRTAVFSPSRAPPAARVNRRHGIALSHLDGGAPSFLCVALRCDATLTAGDARRRDRVADAFAGIKCIQLRYGGCACESGQGAAFMGVASQLQLDLASNAMGC